MPALLPDADDWFDSILIAHDTRWDLPLPVLAETLDYMHRVLEAKCAVLRGGAWATRARLIRSTWLNYYGPERKDVLAGFRTCAP